MRILSRTMDIKLRDCPCANRHQDYPTLVDRHSLRPVRQEEQTESKMRGQNDRHKMLRSHTSYAIGCKVTKLFIQHPFSLNYCVQSPKKTATTDGLQDLIMWRNKERETEAEDVGAGSRFCLCNFGLVGGFEPPPIQRIQGFRQSPAPIFQMFISSLLLHFFALFPHFLRST